MHVAVLIDEERLRHEHAALNRICIGLVGEGLEVTRVIPESAGDLSREPTESRLALVTDQAVPMSVLPWSRRDRARRIVEQFGRRTPDCLLATGDDAWTLALDLAEPLGASVALQLWSAGEARRLPTRHRARRVGAYLAPTEPIARELRRQVEPELVACVPPGMAIPSAPRPRFDELGHDPMIAVIGGVRDVASYRAALTGLSRVVHDLPGAQIFLELRGPHEQEIWRHCRRLDLLSHVSTVSYAAHQRQLLAESDVVLSPERYGEMRTTLLDAMASGVAVVAAADPALDMIIDDDTALTVDAAEPESWARSIRRVLTDHDLARTLGASARAHLQRHHRAADVMRTLAALLSRMHHGPAMPITGAPSSSSPGAHKEPR